MSRAQQSLRHPGTHVAKANETDFHRLHLRVLFVSLPCETIQSESGPAKLALAGYSASFDSVDCSAGTFFPAGHTASRTRSPWRFMRSIKRRAQINSAASRLKPRKITSHPGPGVTIITPPASNRVKPATIRNARRTCSTVRTIMGKFRCKSSQASGMGGFELSGHAQSAQVLDLLPARILCDRLSCANRVRFQYTQQPTTIFAFSGPARVLRSVRIRCNIRNQID